MQQPAERQTGRTAPDASHGRQVRVLQVLNQLGVGGIEQWLLHLLRHIDRDRFHVDVALADLTRTEYYEEIEALGYTILPLPESGVFNYPRNFADLVAQHGPWDIVHAHVAMHSGPLMRAARIAGVPVRITHAQTTGYGAPGRPLRQRAYEWACRRWMLRDATHLLALSRDAGESLFGSGVVDDPRFQLSLTMIDLSPFSAPVDTGVTRSSLGIPDGATIVGHVGRFVEQKNHEFLVRVAAEILKRREDVYFVLIGDGRDREMIEQQIADLGLADHFRLLGTRHDVPDLLRSLVDLFLFPTRYEGLGRVVVEAQAAGLPCLVSDGVPVEADVVEELVNRLTLADPPEIWAEEVLRVAAAEPEVTPAQALRAVEASEFNVLITSQKLQTVWLDAVRSAAGETR
ncbi:MAG: glycosyltransferase [Armatimonadota bacterium]